MAKQEPITIRATVLDELSNNKFKVEVNSNHTAVAYLAGSMIENDIRVLVGDMVDVEFSPYDQSTGRIVYRYTEKNGE